MGLQNEIRQKFDEARLARDELNRKTYESVITKITVAEKSGRYELPLSDDVIVELIQKEIKELEETQSFYKTPTEGFFNLSLQIMELQQYLPAPLTLDDVRHIIIDIIKEGETNKGKIIKATISKIGNRFDRSKIPGLVEIGLSGQL